MSSKTTPKDFFLHLAAVVALYSSAIALMSLAFSIVDYLNPDALTGYFAASSIVWPVSMLVVLIPALYVIEWLIGRDLMRMPEKKDIWIRRWRIHLTLFLAGATIVGDLITLINTYLNGEVTSRFIYKVLVIIVVAGAIFAYYLLARATNPAKIKHWEKALAWFGIVVALAAVVGGFVIVGSPAKQRALRFDGQRVDDLATIQYQVIDYWQRKGILPAALADLNDPISDFTMPADPETGVSYGYDIKGTAAGNGTPGNPAFELCATFDLPSQDLSDQATNSANDSWAHPAGGACFERNIDSTMYPPVPAAAIPTAKSVPAAAQPR